MASATTVYVGSIPFGVSEEQVKAILQEVGHVVEFKLIFDRNTGQHQGYGFATYQDTDTAQSAIRNLDGRDIQGRKLKVKESALSTDRKRPAPGAEPGGDGGPRSERPERGGGGREGREREGRGDREGGFKDKQGASKRFKNNVNTLLNLDKVERGQMSAGMQRIIEKVEGMTPNELYELVLSMRNLANQNPDMARHLLKNTPQFVFALLQAQLVIGMVQPQEVQSIIQRSLEAGNATSNTGASAVSSLPTASISSTSSSQPTSSARATASQPLLGAIPQQPPQAQAGSFGVPNFGATASAYPPQQTFAAPPTFSAPPPPRGAPAPSGVPNMSPAQVQQIMSLTSDQLNMLPAPQRDQLINLRNHLIGLIQTGQLKM